MRRLFMRKGVLKRKTLRDACVDKYGEDFGRLYDKVNNGIPIGGFLETVAFIDMVEAVKREINEEKPSK